MGKIYKVQRLIIIGYSTAWGKYIRLCSPVVIVPVVCVVGLGLFERGFPEVGKCVEIGLRMLILLVICQQYLKNIHKRAHSLLERFGLLFCIMIIWSFAAVLTAAGAYNNISEKTKQHCRTDSSNLMSSAPWIKIPYPFQWGPPIFSASHVFGMMGAIFVFAAESTGAYYAAARLAGATPPPAHVLTRSIGLQWLDLLRSMMKEAEWQLNKSVPTVDEYMENAHVSFGLWPVLLPALYFVGPELPEEFVRCSEFHTLFKLLSTCGRLLNDTQTFQRESKQGKLNGVALRMLHGHGVSTEEDAMREMRSLIDSTRRELLGMVLETKGSLVPRECKDLFWMMSKVLHLFYMRNDGYTSLKEMVSAVNAVIHEPLNAPYTDY